MMTMLAAIMALGLSAQIMDFPEYTKELEGTVKGGGTAYLHISLAYPENASPSSVTAMRKAISSIVNTSSIANEFGKVTANQPISRMADYYVNSFTRGLKTQNVYPMTTYFLSVTAEHQNGNFVTFAVADGVYGNGGPLLSRVTVDKSNGNLLNNAYLVTLTNSQLRRIVMSHYECESEFDEDTINNLSLDDVKVSFLEDGVNILWAVSSHFWQETTVPYSEMKPYLTVNARRLLGI